MSMNIIKKLFGLMRVWINSIRINEGLLYVFTELHTMHYRSAFSITPLPGAAAFSESDVVDLCYISVAV
jgi:hypothetical protein